MFGISPLGWVHTLGSLPAIPAVVGAARCFPVLLRQAARFTRLDGAASVIRT